MNDYSFNFNSRLNGALHYQPGEDKQAQVDQLLARQVNELDKFIIFIDPSRAKFKFAEGPVGSLTGDAKTLIEADRTKMEAYINGRLICEAQQRFNSLESVLEFVGSNDELLELMAQDGNFRNQVFENLSQVVQLCEAKQRTRSVAHRFFSNVANLVGKRGWKSELDLAKEINVGLFNKFFGSLDVEGFKQLFSKHEAWTGPEHLRSAFQLLLFARSVSELDLDIFKEQGIKSGTLAEFESVLHACWDGMSERDAEGISSEQENFYESHNILFTRFLTLYQQLYSEEGDEPFREFCYNSLFQKMSAQEIEKFIMIFKEVNRAYGGAKIYEREKEMLQHVPLEKYFSAFPWRTDLQLASLYFVQSVKNQSVKGISEATRFLRSVEYEQEMIRNSKAAARYINPDDAYGIDNTDYPNFLYDFAKNYLNPEEFEILKSNYRSRFTDEESLTAPAEMVVEESPPISASSISEESPERLPEVKIEADSTAAIDEEKTKESEQVKDLAEETRKFVSYLRDDLIQLRWLMLSEDDRVREGSHKKEDIRSNPASLSAVIVGNLNQFFDRHQIISWEEKRDYIHDKMGLLPEELRVLDLLFVKPVKIAELCKEGIVEKTKGNRYAVPMVTEEELDASLEALNLEESELPVQPLPSAQEKAKGNRYAVPMVTEEELDAILEALNLEEPELPVQLLPSFDELEAGIRALDLPTLPTHDLEFISKLKDMEARFVGLQLPTPPRGIIKRPISKRERAI